MEVLKAAKNEHGILRIYQDEDAPNPRKEFDNLGTMICWHRRYDLGDKHNYSDICDFLASITGLEDEDITEEELLAKFKERGDILLPLYLYDHSGITISTGPFSCPWDSGQVGWIYCSKERFLKETGYSAKELFGTDKNRLPEKGEHVCVKGYEHFGKLVEIIGDTAVVDYNYLYIKEAQTPDKTVTVPLADVQVLTNYAEEMLNSEVEEYDKYLTGEVYGYVLSDRFGNETDSCWGFFGSDMKNNGIAENLPDECKELVDMLGYGDVEEDEEEEEWNIKPCEICGKNASFERTDESMPREGDRCDKCGIWVCPDCGTVTENERILCSKCRKKIV
jgi:hypothetical protein